MTDIIDELSDLRACLDWPDEFEDLTGRAVPQLKPRAERSCRRWWPLVAVAALVVVGTVVPVVAHFLSIGAVSIELTGKGVPDDLSTDLDLGTPTALRTDEARPPDLGDPSAAFAGKPPGGYTEVWDDGAGYVLISRFPGDLDEDWIRKRLYENGTLEVTAVRDEVAYWISGEHGFLYIGADGRPAEDTLRLSGSALLWTRGGITYRLESTSRSLAESVALAESMS